MWSTRSSRTGRSRARATTAARAHSADAESISAFLLWSSAAAASAALALDGRPARPRRYGGMPVGPLGLGFQHCGERQQRRLVAVATDRLHAHGQAIARPVERQ